MKYRKLGGTDLQVSVICLGPMRAASQVQGDDEKSRLGERALRAALDAGLNFIHSSYEYGTRWMLRRVLKDHPLRHEMHHVIKVPVPDSKDGGRFDRARFRLRIEEALRDLCTDRIDVLQWMLRSDPNRDELRLPMFRQVLDDVLEAHERLRDEGKARYLMTFPYTVPFAKAAMDTGKFGGVIAYYNLIEMEMADLFADLEKREMGFIAIRPLYEGILTDVRKDQESLPEGDRFREARYASEFLKRAKVAEAFREEIGQSMTRFAIRFALAKPIVASVVVGLNTPQQVEGIVSALDEPLPPAETVARAQALWRRGFDLA